MEIRTPKLNIADPSWGVERDSGGNGVDVGARSVPKWGPEIADSITV